MQGSCNNSDIVIISGDEPYNAIWGGNIPEYEIFANAKALEILAQETHDFHKGKEEKLKKKEFDSFMKREQEYVTKLMVEKSKFIFQEAKGRAHKLLELSK